METLLLSRREVKTLLSIGECMEVVENYFAAYAMGRIAAPKVIGLHTHQGGFHIKAGIINLERNLFVSKTNANFPSNRLLHQLPTIQGVIIICDGDDGRLLALMDSIEISIIRTGAATGVATKYLASAHASVVTICGCGNQGAISLKAIRRARNIRMVYAYDTDPTQVSLFIQHFADIQIVEIQKEEMKQAMLRSDIIVTCTPSTHPFVNTSCVKSGTFIAAVGADSEGKQEIAEELTASVKLVTDLTEQCVQIGELQHAIAVGKMVKQDVYAELGDVISGKRPGRTDNDEIIMFDSTGTALQDAAAAVIVYQRALAQNIGNIIDFGM